MSATVIIPTTGAPELRKAVESVLQQNCGGGVTCYVVVDGSENWEKTYDALEPYLDIDRLKIAQLPINVGANGFYGHRIYAAFTHLVNSKYVLYLDQDNWLEPNHIKSCVQTIEKNNLDWCYSLRNVYSKDAEFICQDNCESLGKWQSYHGMNHVDTNTYCLKTEIAIKLAQVWHGGWGQDRVFLSAITQYFKNWDCTGEYTVNYRVDGGQGSVTSDFFLNGNKIMDEKYKGNFPWTKKTSSLDASQDIILIRSDLG